METTIACGVRGHVRTLELGDMSPSSKAVSCHRTPHVAAISFHARGKFGHNRVAVENVCSTMTQGRLTSSPTLGFETESRWDSPITYG